MYPILNNLQLLKLKYPSTRTFKNDLFDTQACIILFSFLLVYPNVKTTVMFSQSRLNIQHNMYVYVCM